MEKDRVLFWSLLFFLIGVAFGSFVTFDWGVVGCGVGVVLLALFGVFQNKRILCTLLWLSLFVYGNFLVFSAQKEFDALVFSSQETEGVFRVIAYPEEKLFYQEVILRSVRCELGECPSKDVLWQAPLTVSLQVGSRIELTCLLEVPENFDSEFDYRMFLAKNGVGFVCKEASHVGVLPLDFKGKVLSSLFVPKHKLEGALSKILPEPESGLAKGLLLGGSSYLPEGLEEKFSRIGLSHMVAVSGYNITLIAQGLLVLGLFFGLWRKQALWGAVIGIVLFIIMIGMPASALRAGIMAGVVFGALQAGRLAQPMNALLLAGAAMLFFHPLLLRYDLGFQLSFLATLAIVLVIPYFEQFLPEHFFWKSIAEILLITVAVEVFVLPLLLLTFHSFSPLVIIGNFLILLVPYAMALSFFSALLFLFVPGAHVFFAWVAFFVLALITRSVEWLGEMEGMSMAIEHFGVKSFIVWYVTLFIFLVGGKKYILKHRSYEV